MSAILHENTNLDRFSFAPLINTQIFSLMAKKYFEFDPLAVVFL